MKNNYQALRSYKWCVHVITALLSQELDSSQLKELQAALKGFVQKNETLKIETKVSKPPLAFFSS